MKRFAQMSAESQKLFAGVLAAVLIVAASGLSWMTHGRAASAEQRLAESRANRDAMTELVRRFEARQLSGAAVDLSAVITRSLQGKPFQPSLMQQQNGELALRFDNAPFDEVLAWMRELEEAGAVLASVAVAQSPSGGVNLSVVLRGG